MEKVHWILVTMHLGRESGISPLSRIIIGVPKLAKSLSRSGDEKKSPVALVAVPAATTLAMVLPAGRSPGSSRCAGVVAPPGTARLQEIWSIQDR